MQPQGPRQSDPFSQMLFGAPRMNQTRQQHQVPPMQQHQHPPYQQQPRMQFQQPQYQGMSYQHQQQGGQFQQQFHQQQGKKSFKMMNYFKKEDGTLDYEKIGNGFQQVTGIAGQVRPLVKQISPLLAYFKK